MILLEKDETHFALAAGSDIARQKQNGAGRSRAVCNP
jgi:hypothetical protein